MQMYLTHLDDEGNDSPALTFAARAGQLTGGEDAAVLDTPAAAYAEAGRFADAAETARQAFLLAKRKNQRAQAEAIKGRIALYQAGIPFRETRTSTVRPRTDFEPGERN